MSLHLLSKLRDIDLKEFGCLGKIPGSHPKHLGEVFLFFGFKGFNLHLPHLRKCYAPDEKQLLCPKRRPYSTASPFT